jgi:hypothetical protein
MGPRVFNPHGTAEHLSHGHISRTLKIGLLTASLHHAPPNDKSGLQPSGVLWPPETQADGLGWNGGAPSVLGFAATRAQRRRRVAIPAQADGP